VSFRDRAKRLEDRAKLDEKYPEHTKLRAIADDSQKIYNFIQWLSEHDAKICTLDKRDQRWPGFVLEDGRQTVQITDILAAYFEIDQRKIETEKRGMLADMRRMNSESL